MKTVNLEIMMKIITPCILGFLSLVSIHQSHNITRSKLIRQNVSKMQNGKAPGPDYIIGYWFKHLSFFRTDLACLYQRTFKNGEELPQRLCTAKTQLLPKNDDTKAAKNYRPISCLNLMYKLFTSCLNVFVQDHCNRNNIITHEQAGGNKKFGALPNIY